MPERLKPAERLIRQEIERTGPVDFARFVDLALYHPNYGYYNRSASPRGRAGDYFTSLQVSGLFPHIFAEAILQMKETLGTEQFSLIEVGSGGGEFLEEVLKYLERKREGSTAFSKGIKVWAVERSRAARDVLVKRLSRFPRCEVVASIDDIEWMGTLEGCIFSNEFFDALPFRRVKWDGKEWRDVLVSIENDNFVEKSGDVVHGPWTIDHGLGHEIEWRPEVPEIFREWGSRLSRGYVVTVDYGHPRESLLSPTRANGTWMCYHKHKASKNPYEFIGDQDITAHVDFTQLVEAGRPPGFEPGLFCSQGIFLSYVGQKLIESFLANAPDDEKRKRAAAVQQLMHPDAMGETFWALVQTKGVEMPAGFASIPNRLRRLI